MTPSSSTQETRSKLDASKEQPAQQSDPRKSQKQGHGNESHSTSPGQRQDIVETQEEERNINEESNTAESFAINGNGKRPTNHSDPPIANSNTELIPNPWFRCPLCEKRKRRCSARDGDFPCQFCLDNGGNHPARCLATKKQRKSAPGRRPVGRPAAASAKDTPDNNLPKAKKQKTGVAARAGEKQEASSKISGNGSGPMGGSPRRASLDAAPTVLPNDFSDEFPQQLRRNLNGSQHPPRNDQELLPRPSTAATGTMLSPPTPIWQNANHKTRVRNDQRSTSQIGQGQILSESMRGFNAQQGTSELVQGPRPAGSMSFFQTEEVPWEDSVDIPTPNWQSHQPPSNQRDPTACGTCRRDRAQGNKRDPCSYCLANYTGFACLYDNLNELVASFDELEDEQTLVAEGATHTHQRAESLWDMNNRIQLEMARDALHPLNAVVFGAQNVLPPHLYKQAFGDHEFWYKLCAPIGDFEDNIIGEPEALYHHDPEHLSHAQVHGSASQALPARVRKQNDQTPSNDNPENANELFDAFISYPDDNESDQ